MWSLGVILYCLLTGGLPFDDDDESAMRKIVIKGDFEDPEWLSNGPLASLIITSSDFLLDIRDLIHKILQKDPIKRITIPQILAHSWFTSPSSDSGGGTPLSRAVVVPQPIQAQPSATTSDSSATSDSSFRSASSELDGSSATTPDDVSHESVHEDQRIHRNPSQATIRKSVTLEGIKQPRPETVMEVQVPHQASWPSPVSDSPKTKEPPALPNRTPVRTKRRSVSSNLSNPSSPTGEKFPTSFPPQDFASLLGTPAPIIFGTKLERELLNNLSGLGFDTGQIVHSVLSDACDAASAMWWMLMRRAERKAMEETSSRSANSLQDAETRGSVEGKRPSSSGANDTPSTIRAEPTTLLSARSAPELAFIPATPTSTTPSSRDFRGVAKTPPRVASPSHTLLSPASSSTDSQPKSHPSTPGGNSKEKDREKDKEGSKGKREGKMRSGSVSIMQRATTALEAAGLVRKKSAEAMKDEKSKEKDGEKRGAAGDDPRHLHGGSGKFIKSPTSRDTPVPGTPNQDQEVVVNNGAPSSPWVLTRSSNSPPEISPTPSPGDTLTSLPQISPKEGGQHRNRASLLTAFRMWFNEDRRGKRKSAAKGPAAKVPAAKGGVNVPYTHGMEARTPPSGAGRNTVKAKRRTSGSGGTSRKGHRTKGPSISSRRSSSVNSRRSSTASMAQIAVESPQFTLEHMVAMSRQRSDPSHRSFGSRTPNSERGEYNSRSSSVHSRTVGKHRHRRSQSASSAGSLQLARATSPFHRRTGSGSSTRVVRSPVQPAPRPPHLRSNSTTSSIHSLSSSRRGSFYEQSESEAQRTGSPFRPHSRNTLDETPRRGQAHGNTTFVAQKRQTPFQPPLLTGSTSNSSRSSWKKSWGLEPPGWQTRSARLPIEVLSVSPAGDSTELRDVFTGRPSLSRDDDDEWEDMDDVYVGGVGQTHTSASSVFSASGGVSPVDSTFGGSPFVEGPSMHTATRGPASARAQKGTRAGKASSNRTKPGTPPIGRQSPLLGEISLDSVPESRGGRRQLPNTRPGPAFKHAIQEEDEDEGED